MAAPRFTSQSLRFLRALKRNNRREWFASHRDDYETHVRQPMADIIARLADDLPEVLRLSLEPVIVGPANPWHGGRSLVVAGGTARIGPPTARVDPGPRRMRSPL